MIKIKYPEHLRRYDRYYDDKFVEYETGVPFRCVISGSPKSIYIA